MTAITKEQFDLLQSLFGIAAGKCANNDDFRKRLDKISPKQMLQLNDMAVGLVVQHGSMEDVGKLHEAVPQNIRSQALHDAMVEMGAKNIALFCLPSANLG